MCIQLIQAKEVEYSMNSHIQLCWQTSNWLIRHKVYKDIQFKKDVQKPGQQW